MADPKGPETGQGAKGGQGARPRPQTLDLPAKDVSKPAASAKPESSPTAAGFAAGASTENPDAGAAAKPSPAAASSDSGKAETPRPENAAPGAAQPQSSRPALGASAVPPASAAAAPARSAAPVRQGVGLVGPLAAAVGGAALAVLAIALFGKQLIRPPEPDMRRVAAVEAKLDGVGRDLGELRDTLARTAQATDTSAIDAQLGEMSKSITSTIEQANGRVGAVEQELRALSEKVSQPPAPDPALGVLAGRIDGLELRLREAPNAQALQVLGGRLEGLEARQGDLPTKEAVAALSSRVGALTESVGGVEQKIDDALAPLAERVDQLAAALKARPEGDPAARLAVAVAALGGALDEGRPFAPELATVKAAAGENAELAGLDAHAASGLPTRTELAERLKAKLGELPPLKDPPPASVVDRFIASAAGVVKVTPQGAPAEGEDAAGAKRGQLASLAEAGDLEGALAARGDLDEAARAATEEWAGLASARLAAEAAVRSIRTAALARLSAND